MLSLISNLGRRRLLLCLLLCGLSPLGQAQESQQAAIHALIQDLDYLIEHAEELSERYRGDRSSIRFNYPAFIAQLRTTRDRSAIYLNESIQVVHPAPPGTVDHTLIERR